MSYDNEYEKLFFLDIGGKWGYAIMHIRDSFGKKKLRLAKCKRKTGFPKTDKWEWQDIDPSKIENLSQVSKINIKSKKELEICFEKMLEEIESIEKDIDEE